MRHRPFRRIRIGAHPGAGAALPVLAALDVRAMAETPAFVGLWAAERAHCAKPNQPQSDSGPEIIGADDIFGWEYSCDIAQVDLLRFGKAWRIRLDCLDAGFGESRDEIWSIAADDQSLRIGADGSWGAAYRCAATDDDKTE